MAWAVVDHPSPQVSLGHHGVNACPVVDGEDYMKFLAVEIGRDGVIATPGNQAYEILKSACQMMQGVPNDQSG